LDRLKSLLKIAKASRKCIKIIKKENIKAVISVGGYSAAPASIGAILTNTPLFIHEQNAVMGRLNKILSPFSKRVFCSFLPPFDPYPVSKEFILKKRVRKEIKNIIFLGGSQGAREINDFALSVAKDLKKMGINISHQTGKKDFERVKKEYEKLKIEVDIFDFDKNIADKISIADFAVSRAGASTLWELTSNAIPTLFFPYPYAAGNHQYFNAKFLTDRGFAFLVKKDKKKEFFEIIKSDIHQISKNLSTLNSLDGAKFIIDEIFKIIKE